MQCRIFVDVDCDMKVEGTLYRVHEYLFTANSAFWSEKLSVRADKTASIKLENVTQRDMDALLSILYDTCVCLL